MRWIALAIVLLSGCAATRQHPAPPMIPATRLVEIDNPTTTSISRNSRNHASMAVPRNILILSGGGVNGAYVAGVLKGWTASGTRPQFDVVTGISTGALIATFAFLGPEYDDELEHLYTSMRQEHIFRPRLLWLDSLVSPRPLQQQIASAATPEILQQVALAYRQGRRLYVGTTNLDTKRLVVWDMGAIAARNTLESQTLFREVLLASCSIPGLFPPVPIDIEIDGRRFTELHVDGGITACVFLEPAMIGLGPSTLLVPHANPLSIYTLVAGKLHQNATPTKPGLFSIVGESVNTALQAKLEGELTQLFLLARYTNATYRLAGIPQDYQLTGDTMSFDPKIMRRLFDEGYRGGKAGTTWQSAPPGLDTRQVSTPRTDTRFTTTQESPSSESWTPDKIRITLDNSPTDVRNNTTAVQGDSHSQQLAPMRNMPCQSAM